MEFRKNNSKIGDKLKCIGVESWAKETNLLTIDKIYTIVGFNQEDSAWVLSNHNDTLDVLHGSFKRHQNEWDD